MATKFGEQPARAALREAGYPVRKTSEEFGVTFNQLRLALSGAVRPSEHIQARLSELLSMPITDLFTAEALSFPYNPRIGTARKAAKR